jgi:hypothetical protein
MPAYSDPVNLKPDGPHEEARALTSLRSTGQETVAGCCPSSRETYAKDMRHRVPLPRERRGMAPQR